jgi:hypothetical protein
VEIGSHSTLHRWVAAVLVHLAADRINRRGFPEPDEMIVALDLDEFAYEATINGFENMTDEEIGRARKALRINRL